MNQGEDTEDWAYDEPVETEVNAPTNYKLQFFEFLSQETLQEVNSFGAHEVRKCWELNFVLNERNIFEKK